MFAIVGLGLRSGLLVRGVAMGGRMDVGGLVMLSSESLLGPWTPCSHRLIRFWTPLRPCLTGFPHELLLVSISESEVVGLMLDLLTVSWCCLKAWGWMLKYSWSSVSESTVLAGLLAASGGISLWLLGDLVVFTIIGRAESTDILRRKAFADTGCVGVNCSDIFLTRAFLVVLLLANSMGAFVALAELDSS